MNATFEDLSLLAETGYAEAYSPIGRGVFALTLETGTIEFIHAAGDPAGAAVRTKVLDLAEVPRSGDFAKAALAGNFFWSGTNGATLSVGADNALYATERRMLDELCAPDGLAQCLDDFAGTIADWRERSAIYA